MEPSRDDVAMHDGAADAPAAPRDPEIKTYRRHDHDQDDGWCTLVDIAAATGGAVSALSLRKRVHRLRDTEAVIWRPTKDEMQQLAAQGAFSKSAQQGILVAHDFVAKLCPEVAKPPTTPSRICGQKRAHGGGDDDDLDEPIGDDDADSTTATKRPTVAVAALALPAAPSGLAPFERLSMDGGDHDDDDDGGDDVWSFVGAAAGGRVTESTVSFASEDEMHDGHAPSRVAELAVMAAGGLPEKNDEAASSHDAAGPAPPGLVRRRGKGVVVPHDATDEQRFMLKVLSVYAKTRIAKNKMHQFVKTGTQFVLKASVVHRSGSFKTVCRNSDLLATRLFVDVLNPSTAVTGVKATVAPAEVSVWRRVGAELGVQPYVRD